MAAGLVALAGLGRVALGAEAPTDVLVGVAIGVAIPLALYRLFAPNEVFPISYRRGRAAHLDVTGQRGAAIQRGLEDQLGLQVEEVTPFGLAGSAGSTPLRIKVKGDPPTYLFGKLYARSHLRADRWYKLDHMVHSWWHRSHLHKGSQTAACYPSGRGDQYPQTIAGERPTTP